MFCEFASCHKIVVSPKIVNFHASNVFLNLRDVVSCQSTDLSFLLAVLFKFCVFTANKLVLQDCRKIVCEFGPRAAAVGVNRGRDECRCVPMARIQSKTANS